MCNHSAPPLIILLHSAVSCPKSEARTEGDMIARGMILCQVGCDGGGGADGWGLGCVEVLTPIYILE
jgi:hypothetical protein